MCCLFIYRVEIQALIKMKNIFLHFSDFATIYRSPFTTKANV